MYWHVGERTAIINMHMFVTAVAPLWQTCKCLPYRMLRKNKHLYGWFSGCTAMTKMCMVGTADYPLREKQTQSYHLLSCLVWIGSKPNHLPFNIVWIGSKSTHLAGEMVWLGANNYYLHCKIAWIGNKSNRLVWEMV